MACCEVLLVGQDAGVETDHDAYVLAEMLVALGGKLWRHTGETDNRVRLEIVEIVFKSCFDVFCVMCFQCFY